MFHPTRVNLNILFPGSAMSTQIDKTTQVLKQKFDALADVDTASNRRGIREMRRRLKQQMHKRERNQSKRELSRLLNLDTD
jgi:hypothetical protein